MNSNVGCNACDRAEKLIPPNGNCVGCGGELEPTGEQITISGGPIIFICQECRLPYHIPESTEGIYLGGPVLADFPKLKAKWKSND